MVQKNGALIAKMTERTAKRFFYESVYSTSDVPLLISSVEASLVPAPIERKTMQGIMRSVPKIFMGEIFSPNLK